MAEAKYAMSFRGYDPIEDTARTADDGTGAVEVSFQRLRSV